jgi:hypothetical protein
MAQTWDLSSETVQQNFLVHVSNLRLAGKPVRVQFVPEKRSLDQNAMIYALYKQIAEQLEDQSIQDIRRECKLRHGVPILRTGDPKFKAMYDKAIRGNLNYEEKLQAMDYLPVTRLMSKEQGTEFIDVVIREYSQQGLCLLSPSELAA